MHVAVIINRDGGAVIRQDIGRRRIEAAFEAAGLEASVEMTAGTRVAQAARRALSRGAKVVVAGGGDGTIGAVAGVLAGTDAVLGVLPLGTANHFAKDLGIPCQLEAAARMIAEGEPGAVGAAEVNGHVFVNNVSLGYYPLVVEERRRLRRRLVKWKWLAQLLAAFKVLLRFPLLHLHIGADGYETTCEIPIIFVGTSPYVLNFFAFGAPERAPGEEIFVYVPRRERLVRYLLLALVKDLAHDPAVASYRAATLRISSPQPELRACVDGEVHAFRTPLHFRMCPGALRVMLPSGLEGKPGRGSLRRPVRP